MASNAQNSTFTLKSTLQSDTMHLNCQRVDYVGSVDDILTLAINFLSIMSQVWERESFEPLFRPITFRSTDNAIFDVTIKPFPSGPMIPRPDHVLQAFYTIWTRTFLGEGGSGDEPREIWNWQVSKDAGPFMQILFSLSENLETGGGSNGTDFTSLSASTTATGSSMPLDSKSNGRDYGAAIAYKDRPLSVEDMLLFFNNFIFKQMRHEPSDPLPPNLGEDYVEFMSPGRRSYGGRLNVNVPGSQLLDPSVAYTDVVQGLRTVLYRIALSKQELCFTATMNRSAVPVLEIGQVEIMPLVRGVRPAIVTTVS